MTVRPPIALVRDIPDSLDRALSRQPRARRLDIDRARAQHAAYVAALRRLDVEVRELPADARFPDGCFVEDVAIVLPEVAVMTRPGAASRRGEGAAVRAALEPLVPLVVDMAAPACLDGGDVLVVGRTLLVGSSERTGEAGARALADAVRPWGYEVVRAPVQGALHLKCFASLAAPGLVVAAQGWLDPALLGGASRLLPVPWSEAFAANVVALPHRRAALVHTGFPQTAAALAGEGIEVVEVDMSELALVDGSLTCCSLWVPSAPGGHPAGRALRPVVSGV